jgi:hypothetical protein
LGGFFTLGSFLQIMYRNNPHYFAPYFRGKRYVLILTKNGLGYILGDFLQTHLVTLATPNTIVVRIEFHFLPEPSNWPNLI